jgi:hypothetical protein
MTDKRFFQIAAGWNFAASLGALAQPALFYRLAYAYDGPIDGVWLQIHVALWFLIALFGLGYGLAGYDPVHYRGAVVLGVIGKVAFGLFWIGAFIAGRVTVLLLAGAVGDLVFAALFVRWLRKHPIEGHGARLPLSGSSP